MRNSFRSHSVADTEAIAAEIARDILPSGDCIALHGELGAGKTQFVRGLAKAFGGDGREVSSPTFVLLNVYDTPRRKIFHLDAYRVTGADELDGIGFGELLQQGGLVVVEWAERVVDLMPANHLSIRITPTGARSRKIDAGR